MGNQQCKECVDTYIENQAYGTHELLQQNDGIFALIQKRVDGDQSLKNDVSRQLEQRTKIRHLNIVKLHSYQLVDQNYGFKAIMKYEYITKTLKDRMKELENKPQEPSQRQLLSLLYGVQSGLQQLNSHGIKHCCINLQTILLKNNLYKITDMSSTTYVTSYDLVRKGSRNQYLSEKLLNHLQSRALCPFYELKDDYFSLGIIGLAFATHKDPKNFYIWDQKGNAVLNVKAIQNSMREAKKKYSSKMFKQIKSLIFAPEQDLKSSNSTTLTENLAEFEHQLSSVLEKASRVGSLVSPAWSERQGKKVSSFSTSPKKKQSQRHIEDIFQQQQ